MFCPPTICFSFYFRIVIVTWSRFDFWRLCFCSDLLLPVINCFPFEHPILWMLFQNVLNSHCILVLFVKIFSHVIYIDFNRLNGISADNKSRIFWISIFASQNFSVFETNQTANPFMWNIVFYGCEPWMIFSEGRNRFEDFETLCLFVLISTQGGKSHRYGSAGQSWWKQNSDEACTVK